MEKVFRPFHTSFGGEFKGPKSSISNQSHPSGPLQGRKKVAGKISNAGTSAGVKKEWLVRHGGSPEQKDDRDSFSEITSRKPTEWKDSEIATTSWNDLSQGQKDAFKSKPKIDLSHMEAPYEDHPDIVAMRPHRQIEFHGERGGKHYYINTEGSSYPRYVARISDVPADLHNTGTPIKPAPGQPTETKWENLKAAMFPKGSQASGTPIKPAPGQPTEPPSASPETIDAAAQPSSIPAKNKTWGFYGTVNADDISKKAHWDKMFKALHSHVTAEGGTGEDTRNLLDSVHGRHLADMVIPGTPHESVYGQYAGPKSWKKIIKGTIAGRDAFNENESD